MEISPIELAERVQLWQQRLPLLGISHWRIQRVTVGGDDGRNANATAGVSPHYDFVYFYFNSDWLEEVGSMQELDETIVHEWVHVAGRDVDEVQSLVEDWMPRATWTMYHDAYHHAREGEVDRFAKQIVNLFEHGKDESGTIGPHAQADSQVA